jgi:predicted ribosomally synthesized peptide with nif11-like leader
MSLQALDQFMLHVTRDEELQDTVRELDPQDFASLVKVANDNGYDSFTQEEYFKAADKVGGEWGRFAAQMRGQEVSDELSDRELEQVAGGKGDCSTSTVCFSTFCDNMC